MPLVILGIVLAVIAVGLVVYAPFPSEALGIGVVLVWVSGFLVAKGLEMEGEENREATRVELQTAANAREAAAREEAERADKAEDEGERERQAAYEGG